MQPPVLLHNITPEQAFGEASRLALTGSESTLTTDYGSLFQIAVVVIGFTYTFFIVRYWDFLRTFILNSIGVHVGNKKGHINPGEQTNIEVVMIILGVLTLSLCALRGFGEWRANQVAGTAPDISLWLVLAVGLATTALTLGFQFGAILLSASICERSDIGHALAGIKSLYLAVGFVVTIPFGILFLLSAPIPSAIGFWGIIFCAAISLILFVKETFFFFVSQKISILHWILYLCALEIFPASLILAPFLR